MWIPYSWISQAVRDKSAGYYTMSLKGEVASVVSTAVNQGIDSHLEACFVPDRGDSFQVSSDDPNMGLRRVFLDRLNCVVSAESMPVLLRRLTEMAVRDPVAGDLVDAIMGTLGIEYEGEVSVGEPPDSWDDWPDENGTDGSDDEQRP